MAKYIFVTGGVTSGLGKGIIAASLGRLLKARGFRVSPLKLDPYFNLDSAFISPKEHGEIFVTKDGTETDLVVGHYERILNDDLCGKNMVTSGRIYRTVMEKERKGEYSETVQIVPHITDEIKKSITALDDGKTDIILSEIGGTVGDIECTPFLEAIRQIQGDVGKKNVAFVHITLVPFIEMSREQKTKPTQRSVKELQDVGIQPDAIVCRSDYPILAESKKRLAQFCNISADGIITCPSEEEIYQMPLRLEEEGLAAVILKKLQLSSMPPELSAWKAFTESAAKSKAGNEIVKIAIVGKYKPFAYVSVTDALFCSAAASGKTLQTEWIASDGLTDIAVAEKALLGFDGVVIPAGFGERGFDGKVFAAEIARKSNLPCLSIGLGAQAAVCGILKSGSEEFGFDSKIAAVRRSASGFVQGRRESILCGGTKIAQIYGNVKSISERHRHKFEINPSVVEKLKEKGVTVSALYGDVPEAFEIGSHKFFIGVVFRPEFSARPEARHPLFDAFMKAAADGKNC